MTVDSRNTPHSSKKGGRWGDDLKPLRNQPHNDGTSKLFVCSRYDSRSHVAAGLFRSNGILE